MRVVALVLAVLLIVPAVSAHHGTDVERASCSIIGSGGGLVGVVFGALGAAVCLSGGFADAASHLTLCLLFGGSGC